MLRIDIAPLKDGVHELVLHPSADDLGLDPATFADVEVDLRLDLAADGTGRRARAAFEARAVATLECDRTLALFEQPVAGEHHVLFVPAAALPEGAEDDDAVRPLPADAPFIDLAEPVRDTLLLALPLRRVSPEAEAAELPATFGALLDDEGAPLDPRWEALRRLREAEGEAPDGAPRDPSNS